MMTSHRLHPRTHQNANGELIEHLYEGWLNKKGRGKLKSYKLRYFVLTEQRELEYYKDDKCIYNHLLGVITLEGAKIALSQTNDCKMTIKSRERTLTLKTDTPKDRAAWTEWLLKALNLANIMSRPFIPASQRGANQSSNTGSPHAAIWTRKRANSTESDASAFEYEDSKIEDSISSTSSMACECKRCDICKEKIRRFQESLLQHVEEIEKETLVSYSELCEKWNISSSLCDYGGDDEPPRAPHRTYNSQKAASNHLSNGDANSSVSDPSSVDAPDSDSPIYPPPPPPPLSPAPLYGGGDNGASSPRVNGVGAVGPRQARMRLETPRGSLKSPSALHLPDTLRKELNQYVAKNVTSNGFGFNREGT